MTHTPTPWEVQHMPTETECRKRGDWVMLHGDDWFRAQACVSFFHGQDIPTERIEEGGFWEMVDFVKTTRNSTIIRYGPQAQTALDATALLAKLGVEP